MARMQKNGQAPALYWQDSEYPYNIFKAQIDAWTNRLASLGISQGAVCGILGDYSPQACTLIFALMRVKAIIVPFTYGIEVEMDSFLEIAGVQFLFRFDEADQWTLETFTSRPQNDLVVSYLSQQEAGLIVFTSGSTGKPKGILHNCERVMRKFVDERPGWRTVLFLMLDHFGGFNTLLSTFAYGGTGVCVPKRTPETVCKIIERSNATLLPTTPTFLNLLLASGSYSRYNLSSVKLITYGTEVMPETTLLRIQKVFPNAGIKQTYGLSELGVLRSKSQSDDSLWVKIGGHGFDVKVEDHILWVRSEANMVGYLNAPSPFDGDGWMCTGDQVEVQGEYMRIVGRKSEVINVGGQKVVPVEVETVLLQADNIREATVYAVTHPLLGQVAQARVSLEEPETPLALTERLRKFCVDRMAKYKIPMRFVIIPEDEQHNERFKKIRK